MRIKKIAVLLCISMFLFTSVCPVFGDEVDLPHEDVNKTEKKTDDEVLKLTVASAVDYALENNCTVKMLDNKLDLAVVAYNNAKRNVDDFEDAEEQLSDATKLLSKKKNELMTGQSDLATAQKTFESGIAPSDIPVPNVGTISAGKNIHDWFSNEFPASVKMYIEGQIRAQLVSAGYTGDALEAAVAAALETKIASIESEVVKNIRDMLVDSQNAIDTNLIAYNEAAITLNSKREEFNNTLKKASDEIGTQINYNSIVTFDVEQASDLMINMAGVNLDLTRYAKSIYINQIAMLVQKNYYDVLYAEKVLALKKVAKERGEEQYNIVQLSYDTGMKAKDDLLLSKMYYDGTVIEYHLAEANYEKALLELHKNMNLDLDTEIALYDNMLSEVTEDDLEAGLKLGLKNRIEIRKVLGQLTIYKLNQEILETKYKYIKSYDMIHEAQLLTEAANIEFEQIRMSVETEIRQSYVVMVEAGEMLKASEELVKNAEEVLAIAQIKYDQGFGAENSLLSQMNLVQSSGTIIELIAAQENLAKMQAQVAQIRYSYTMAKIKYFNDAGILVY